MGDFFSISISTIFLLAGVSFAGKPVAFQLHLLSAQVKKRSESVHLQKNSFGHGTSPLVPKHL